MTLTDQQRRRFTTLVVRDSGKLLYEQAPTTGNSLIAETNVLLQILMRQKSLDLSEVTDFFFYKLARIVDEVRELEDNEGCNLTIDNITFKTQKPFDDLEHFIEWLEETQDIEVMWKERV